MTIELRSDFSVKHNSSGSFRLTAPGCVLFDGIREGLDNFQHACGHIVSIYLDHTIFDVSLDLLIGEFGEGLFEIFVECFLEGLAHQLVIRLDRVLDECVLVVI